MLRARIALVLASALAAAPAWADYRDTFRRGIEALDRRDWAAAASLMRQARAEHPEEGERIRIVGMRFEVYLPAYYLGLALFQSGDCAGALEALDASAAQGAVGRTGEMARLESMRGECRPKVQAVAPTPTRVAVPTRPAGPPPGLAEAQRRSEEELRNATDAANAVAALRRNPEFAPVWRNTPELSSRADQAALGLAAARGRYEAGRSKGDLKEVEAAGTQAGAAQRELAAVRSEVEARRAEVRATKPVVVAEQPTAIPSPVPTRPSAPTPAEPAVPASAPAEVKAAAAAFLAGEYRAALTVLSAASFPDPRANAAAALIRSACGHALYLAGGRTDSGLLARASSDAALCRRLAPSLAPDRRAFSPSFAEFFRQAR
ncbi:MAG: hypothetical protein ACOY3Y_13035 [Acidobacteriota bacterium]